MNRLFQFPRLTVRDLRFRILAAAVDRAEGGDRNHPGADPRAPRDLIGAFRSSSQAPRALQSDQHFRARQIHVSVLRGEAASLRVEPGPCHSPIAGGANDLGERGVLLCRLQSAQGRANSHAGALASVASADKAALDPHHESHQLERSLRGVAPVPPRGGSGSAESRGRRLSIWGVRS